MKYRNIKNKPKKCGRWLFLHSRFSKIFRGRTPRTTLLKGIHQLNPQNLSSTTTTVRQKRAPPPMKTNPVPVTVWLYV